MNYTDRLTSVGYLSPRVRERLNRAIRARNALDRATAERHGVSADDPRCARFQGVQAHETLDRLAARRGWLGGSRTSVAAIVRGASFSAG